MTAQEIIEMFELYLDDTSELSSAEELALLNRVYKEICRDRPWEFLRTEKTGTLSISVPYIALPDDFLFMADNHGSENESDNAANDDKQKVVFVGTARVPYEVVSFANRRNYKDKSGYCYVDIVNNRLYFTLQPTAADSYEFDYIALPASLATTDEPIFKVAHETIAYGMAVDSYIIQQFEKARSYAPENQQKYLKGITDIAYWNAQLIIT